MFGSLGSTELIIVLVVILIIFGAGKLPNVMRDLGKGVSEFKKAQTDVPAAETEVAPPVAAQAVTATAPAPPVSPMPVAAASRPTDTAPRA